MGDHLYHMFPTILEVKRVWPLFEDPYDPKPPLVSQQHIQQLVN
jgi:hypothetical protein